jgi:hypothetical protein
MPEVRVRSVAAGQKHSLALGWDGRVYSWGKNEHGQLGHGDQLQKSSPTLMEGLDSVRSIAAACDHSLVVTQSGDVFGWGCSLLRLEVIMELRPIIVQGFGGVRVRRVCAGQDAAFAIGDDGELFSWGRGDNGLLGHGDEQDQASPKRVEAMRGIRIISVSVGADHAIAFAEDGLVYTWGENKDRAVLGNPNVETKLLPKPVEALRGVRIGVAAAGGHRSFAVADAGELWAWGFDKGGSPPLGHGEQQDCASPKPIESLRGIKMDAVTSSGGHTLAVAGDGSVYAWGCWNAAGPGALGLGPVVACAFDPVDTPQRVPALRVTCGGR